MPHPIFGMAKLGALRVPSSQVGLANSAQGILLGPQNDQPVATAVAAMDVSPEANREKVAK
jgi:hypothetical protein